MSDSVFQGNGNADHLNPTLDFLAGTAAGVSGIIVGFPFDTVKYRFQNPSLGIRYHSTLHALATITREERLGGLYKGISSPLATAPLLNGMLFATYRFLMKLQTQTRPSHDGNENGNHARPKDLELEPTLGQVFLAGAGCGLASTLLTTPIELVKIQQQKQQQQLTIAHGVTEEQRRRRTISTISSDGHTLPARAVALRIYRAGGICGLYRGLSATILRDVGGYGLYFFGYEGTLRLFAPSNPAHHADPALVLDEVADTLSGHPHPNTNPRPWAPLLLAGGAAGIIGWLGTFPFDVIKTRMQAHDIGNSSAHVHVHSGSGSLAGGGTLWRAARELYAEAAGDGGGGGGARMRVFWRGFVPTIVRAVPVNMAVFGTFESVVWAFS